MESERMDALEKQILEKVERISGNAPSLDDSLALIGVDSVGMAELTFEIEKHFQIQVDDQVLDVETVRDLADYVRLRRGILES